MLFCGRPRLLKVLYPLRHTIHPARHRVSHRIADKKTGVTLCGHVRPNPDRQGATPAIRHDHRKLCRQAFDLDFPDCTDRALPAGFYYWRAHSSLQPCRPVLTSQANETRKRGTLLLSNLTDDAAVCRNQTGNGNHKRNRAPPSGEACTVSVPPWASRARRLIANPSPKPPVARSRLRSRR